MEGHPKMGKDDDDDDDDDADDDDNDEGEVQLTKGMLKEILKDVLGQKPRSKRGAGQTSPPKKPRSSAIKEEKALDKRWERRTFCVSD